MAAFIARGLSAAGVALPPPGVPRFTDVPAGSANDVDVRRLAAAGIVHGGPEGLPATSYGPELRVRRDQVASFVVRLLTHLTTGD
jgi:hypothetical protein